LDQKNRDCFDSRPQLRAMLEKISLIVGQPLADGRIRFIGRLEPGGVPTESGAEAP
jgi:hypothetical protein